MCMFSSAENEYLRVLLCMFASAENEYLRVLLCMFASAENECKLLLWWTKALELTLHQLDHGRDPAQAVILIRKLVPDVLSLLTIIVFSSCISIVVILIRKLVPDVVSLDYYSFLFMYQYSSHPHQETGT